MLNKIECYELNKLKDYLDTCRIKYAIKSDPFGCLTSAEVIELIERYEVY